MNNIPDPGSERNDGQFHSRPDALSAAHKKALAERGLHEGTAKAAGLFSADAAGVSHYVGHNPNRSGGLIIPYRDPTSCADILYRARLDTPMKAGNGTLRYLHPTGVRNYLYFPPGAQEWLSGDSPTLITEGELKSLALFQYGIPAISCPGVWGWKSKKEKTGTIPCLDLMSWHKRTITLAFDNDILTKKSVEQALTALAAELYARGAGSVVALDIPYTEGVKLGVDDYIAAFGIDALLDLDAHTIANPAPQLKIWSFGELMAAQHPRPAFLCEGLGLREGETAIIAGAGGTGKSLLALQLAQCLAAGRAFLDNGRFSPARPYRVGLYLSEESLGELSFRASATAQGIGFSQEERTAVYANLHLLDFQGSSINLEDGATQNVLRQTVQNRQLDLLIIDPLSSVHNRNENDNAQMRRVLEALAPIQYQSGLCVVYVHHEAQSVAEDSHAARGGTAIRDTARALIRLQSHGYDATGLQTLTLSLAKANYVRSGSKLSLNRKINEYHFTIAEESGVSIRRVWELVSGGMWESELKELLMKETSISEKWARESIRKAENSGLVFIEVRTNPDTGRSKKWILRAALEDTEEL